MSRVQKVDYPQKPIVAVRQRSPTYEVEDYRLPGAAKKVRKLRMRDPREQERESTDYRSRTPFQQDYYETVIISKNRIVLEAQWVYWYHLQSMDNPYL